MPPQLSDFDFELPQELIAQEGLAERDSARMMVLRPSGAFEHQQVRDLPSIWKSGDLVVRNDTRVARARLFGKKDTGRKVDCLIVSDSVQPEEKEALLRGKAFGQGSTIAFQTPGGKTFSAEVMEWLGGSKYRLRFSDPAMIQECAKLPIPPYIKKPLESEERYQTVYSKLEGSLAAPTAGLHFTPELIQKLEGQGVEFASVTLHVGIGTFAPIREQNLELVKLHAEHFSVTEETAERINLAIREGRRIFAVGTTSVRCLESAMDGEMGRMKASSGWTEIFIYPGYVFKTPLAGMMTNFHLPESSLLCLTGAFIGRERLLSAYAEAIKEKYRFYSLGDSMLILK